MLMQTTAIYPNRITDKEALEKKAELPEFPDGELYFFANRTTLEPIAFGYRRVVYGDHGPYIEFEPDQIKAKLLSRFPGDTTPKHCYYEWLFPEGYPNIKIYRQLRDVKHLKNPPKGGFRGNREEGYADYIPGMYYIAPDDVLVVTSHGLRQERSLKEDQFFFTCTQMDRIPESFEIELAMFMRGVAHLNHSKILGHKEIVFVCFKKDVPEIFTWLYLSCCLRMKILIVEQ